ncbi:MAG TPA: hypothetical protein VEF34_13955 [Syntrophobacteraceae bacterium]|nr:hypothetical protein [Syntrophobacteraceae bacterium]
MKKLAGLVLVVMCLCSCATGNQHPQVRHPEFTRQKVVQIYLGMTPSMIEALFGLPDVTSTTTMGAQTSQPWSALVYGYNVTPPMPSTLGMSPNEVSNIINAGTGGRGLSPVFNTFYFTLSTNPPTLALWDVRVAY